MIISLHVEKLFDKIQLMIKTSNKLVIEGNFFNLINCLYRKPSTNIILDKDSAFPLRLETKQGLTALVWRS